MSKFLSNEEAEEFLRVLSATLLSKVEIAQISQITKVTVHNFFKTKKITARRAFFVLRLLNQHLKSSASEVERLQLVIGDKLAKK